MALVRLLLVEVQLHDGRIGQGGWGEGSRTGVQFSTAGQVTFAALLRLALSLSPSLALTLFLLHGLVLA